MVDRSVQMLDVELKPCQSIHQGNFLFKEQVCADPHEHRMVLNSHNEDNISSEAVWQFVAFSRKGNDMLFWCSFLDRHLQSLFF